MKKKKFCTDRLEHMRQNKNLLYRQDKTSEPTKEEQLSFVLFESPFTSVSTVSRGQPHPSLVSLIRHVVLTASVSLNFMCEIVFYSGKRRFMLIGAVGSGTVFFRNWYFYFLFIFIFPLQMSSLSLSQSHHQHEVFTQGKYSRYRVADPHLAFSRELELQAAFLTKWEIVVGFYIRTIPTHT
jgi:hypothetical protein